MEWISETLEKVSFWSGVLSVFGGVLAYILAELLSAKASAPFMASVPLLILGLCMCWSNWTENKSLNRQTKFAKSCMNGLKEIVQNRSVLLCGILQALFEAVISIFVFLWGRIRNEFWLHSIHFSSEVFFNLDKFLSRYKTPVLDKHSPPLGIVFASFMAANVVGSRINSFLLLKFKNITIRDNLIRKSRKSLFFYFKINAFFSIAQMNKQSCAVKSHRFFSIQFRLNFFSCIYYWICIDWCFGWNFTSGQKFSIDFIFLSHSFSICCWYLCRRWEYFAIVVGYKM